MVSDCQNLTFALVIGSPLHRLCSNAPALDLPSPPLPPTATGTPHRRRAFSAPPSIRALHLAFGDAAAPPLGEADQRGESTPYRPKDLPTKDFPLLCWLSELLRGTQPLLAERHQPSQLEPLPWDRRDRSLHSDHRAQRAATVPGDAGTAVTIERVETLEEPRPAKSAVEELEEWDVDEWARTLRWAGATTTTWGGQPWLSDAIYQSLSRLVMQLSRLAQGPDEPPPPAHHVGGSACVLWNVLGYSLRSALAGKLSKAGTAEESQGEASAAVAPLVHLVQAARLAPRMLERQRRPWQACSFYALSMPFLCSFYALSMLFLCSFYALSMRA